MTFPKTKDFYKTVDYAEIRAVKGVPRETGIRAYCSMSGQAWTLQVRAPQHRTNGGGELKAFMIASATLSLDDMRDLRDALSSLIDEAEASGPAQCARPECTNDALPNRHYCSDACWKLDDPDMCACGHYKGEHADERHECTAFDPGDSDGAPDVQCACITFESRHALHNMCDPGRR